MKLQNELSIKSALRFALPCLASALLFTACSNDDSEPIPGGSDNVTAGTVRFTASAPLTSDATTRIGIDDANKPTVDQFETEEPVIWIAGDEVSVFFDANDGSQPIHARFKVDDTTLSTDKKSADLINADELEIPDGTYTVYAFTPYKATNTLESISLNLSNQTQALSHTDYSHLGNTASMRAMSNGAQFTGGVPANNVNFEFKHITSFLRFRITNSLSSSITVTSISLSHPSLFSAATYNAKTDGLSAGANSSLQLSLGGKSLSSNESFDAYFSAFPIPTSYSSSDELELTINYDGGDDPQKVFEILPNELIGSTDTELFPVGTRFLFDVQIPVPSTEQELENLPENIDKVGNVYVTSNRYFSDSMPYDIYDGVYFYYITVSNDAINCPPTYDLLTYHWLRDNIGSSSAATSDLLTSISYAYGFFDDAGNYRTAPFHYMPVSNPVGHFMGNTFEVMRYDNGVSHSYNGRVGYGYDLRCVKMSN